MSAGGKGVVRTAVAEGRLEVLQIYKLLQCVREGNRSRVEKMVQLGVPNLINLTDPREGSGVLHLVSVENDLDMAEFLLTLGAHPDVQDRRGRTAVILAAELGHDGMMELLAKNRANMNLVDNEGKGVLFYCISPTKRHARCLQVALNSNANVNNVSNGGTPVFLLACEHAEECESFCISMLERGADANSTHQVTGRTALMEAARSGSVRLVRSILQRGANPNLLDKERVHAAHLAARHGHFQVLLVLSAYSADLGVVSVDGNTALHVAAAGGHAECCRFLTQRGCNPKLKNLLGLVPRQMAKEHGHSAALKELKKAERSFTKFSRPGVDNPNQLWALRLHDWSHEHQETLRKVLQPPESPGPPVENVSKEAFTSVLQSHRAPVDQEHLQKIVSLHDVKRDGTINLEDFFKGLKYLQKAFVLSSYAPKQKKKGGKSGKGKGKKGRGAFVAPLPICTRPPDTMERRGDGGPPLFMIESYQPFTDTKRFDRDRPPAHPVEDDSAWYVDEPERIYTHINRSVRTDDFESLCLAFSEGVPVDVRDPFYKTPLMVAAGSGNYQMVEFLISLGADVNASDQFRWTPLHHACHAGQAEITELLLKHGALLDAEALNGATPLMRAIQSCRSSCVDLLIRSGAKVSAQNKKDQSCLDVARLYGDERIIDLVKTKLDALPKLKENRKGSASPSVRAAPPAPPQKDVLAGPRVTGVNLKENIITINPQNTASAGTATTVQKLDIRFTPKTVWGKRLASSAQHLERRVDRRNLLSYEVDFKDSVTPFMKNINRKLMETGVV
ncbi:ankyrin repeat and EF-hand domain-containing protein 1 isoform X2 [Trichomycterus rosablanca]|uniref:ankyrin repeat and EF-hand domain-containing protein 1 isoform X2 n=1 Tax=Trichomycterus rosablanca TaxID=2290929 RepID=UPI002F358E29